MSRRKFTEEEKIVADKQRVLNCLSRFGPLPVSRVVKHVGINFTQAHFCLSELLQDKQIARRERTNPTKSQIIQEYLVNSTD